MACSLLLNLTFSSLIATSACFVRCFVDAWLMRGTCMHMRMFKLLSHTNQNTGFQFTRSWTGLEAFSMVGTCTVRGGVQLYLTHLGRKLVDPCSSPVADGHQASYSARILCLHAPQLLRGVAVAGLVLGHCLRLQHLCLHTCICAYTFEEVRIKNLHTFMQPCCWHVDRCRRKRVCRLQTLKQISGDERNLWDMRWRAECQVYAPRHAPF